MYTIFPHALLTAILILLLMGVNNAWAASTVQGGYIYFDELNSGYTGAGDMQFWVGHGSYSSSYSMSKIDNTKLWYCSAPSWNDATYFAFTSGADWGGGNQKYYDRIGNNTWKSATKESYTLNSGQYYVFKVASTANKAAINFDSPYGHQGSSYTNLNKTITVKAKVSTNGGGSYAEATSPGTLRASSYKFTATSSCASATSLSSGKITCGYTANTTLTAADANGYTFVGWYNSSGTRQTTDKTLSINPTADATYYAYYTKNTEPSITISTEKTYLRTSYDKLTLNIDYSNIPEGYTYRVHATPEAYFNGNEKGDDVDGVSILGNGNTTFVSHGYLAENQYTVEVILWHNDAATNIKSNSLSITVEPQLSVQTRARFNNQENTTAAEHPQPEWVYPSQHVEETITASEPNPGYTFAGWTANDDNLIKFDNPNSLTTIVTSKVKGNNNAVAYANYAKENCVYFVNTSNWSSVYAYAWNGSGDNVVKNEDWPGVKLETTGKQIDGHDVYKYCDPYEKIIFNNGSNQTGDIIWEDGVTYYPNSGLIKMHGNFTGDWNTTEAFAFSKDGKTATLTLTINNAKTYNFGMRIGKDDNWTSNSSSFSRENNSYTISGNSGNCSFTADVTGEYTFTWTFATNTLTITYPTLSSYTVNFDMKGHGNAIASQSIEQGGKVTKPENPTAEGFTFGGWYTDAECTSEYDFNTTVSSSFTLYAKWIQQYVVVGSGSGTSNSQEMGNWLNGHSWIGDGSVIIDQNNIIQGSKTYEDCPAGIKNFRIVRWNSWDQDHGYSKLTSCNVPYYGNQDENIVFVTIAKADITIGFDGTNITVNVEYDQNDLANVKNSIVTGEKVMFYWGDEWSISDYKYVKDGETNVVTATKGFLLSGVGANKWLSVAVLPSKEYYITNTANGAMTGEAVRAGAIYACYGNNESMGITPGATPTWSNNTISVPLGTAASGLIATCGNSSVGRAQTITDYYYQLEGESTWTKFDHTDVSELSVGIYKVHALAYDGNIYVRTAEPATLTIYDEYTINYKDQGGSAFSGAHEGGYPTTHTYGTATTLKSATKAGYTFVGWFTDSNCSGTAVTSLAATAYTADITLYAKWEERDLWINHDFKGSSSWDQQKMDRKLKENQAIYTYTHTSALNAAASGNEADANHGWTSGYHFEFGEKTSSYVRAYNYDNIQQPTGTGVDAIHETHPDNSTVQFGLPKKSNVTIILTFVTGEEKPNVHILALPYSMVTWEVDGETVRSDELCEGAIITAPEDPSKTGYTFAGWKNKNSEDIFDSNATMPENDVTFVAQWTPTNYTITYNLNGGSGTMTPTSYTIESEDITLSIPTQEGYTFGGWYDNEGCTGEAITTIPQGSTGDKTFYAKWTINSYTITFSTEEGGSVSATVGGNAIASGAPVQYGTSVVLTAFADAGYSFSTWVDGSDNKVTSNPYTVTIDDNITLKAEFIQATTLYLKPNTEWLNNEARFAAYAFDGSDEPVWINMIQKEGECTGIYSCAVPGSYKKVIFCKMNANTASNDWGNKSEQTIDLSIPTDNKNLFTITTKPEGQNWNGEWESEPFNPLAYTITLVGEGGTMEVIHDGESTLGNTTVAPNTVIKIALHPHSGYTLGNNSQIKIGTNDERTLTAEAEYPICGPTTITANWVETKYSVNVKSNNNTYGTVSPTSVNVGQHTPSTKITAAPKPGYRFVNWTATEGVSIATPIWESTTITASQAGTLTANFEKDPVIYLKPSNIWKSDNARFAVYWWADGGKNGWIDMTTVGCNDEYYMAELPAGVTNFQFVRLKPSTEKDYDSSNSGLNFGNKWNQTTDLSLPDNANNLFAMKKLHLNIGNWNEDNKKCYAAHFYNSSNENKTINLIEGDDPMVYYCDIPTDKHYTNVVFYRVDPSNTGNIWQQTNDLSIDGDFYTITSFGGNGNKAEGTWTLQSIGEWLALPLPTITYSQPANGTIIVKTIRGVEIPSGTKVPWDTQVLVSVQPNTGYSVQSANINIGGTVQSVQSGTSYTICGNTTISATMEEHTDYYLVGLDGDWSPKAKNKFVDGKLNINIEGKGTKDFKIIKQQGNTQTWLSTKYTFKPTALKATGITSDNENMKIETMHNGIYQFTWSDGTLTVEYPDVCFLHGDFNDWTDDPSHALYGMDAKVYLEEGVTYEFKVAEKGVYRTQSGNLWQTPITYTEGGKTIIMNDATSYNSEPHHNSKITANMSGVYIFHYNKETKELTVRFPLEPGDYRLAYMEGENTDTFHPERIIKRCISGDQKDIVSFFINHQNNPKIILQKCSTVNANSATWTIENTYVIDNDYSIASTGVFNFVLHQATESDNTTAQLLKKETHPYTGDYYIRTEVAPGKWHSFRRDSHKMTYSSYADDYEPFSHYFCEWVSQTDKGIKNVKFTIANDYGDCISDTLAADPADANPRIVTAESGDLPDSDPNANVRFAWSWRTNKLTRAYLAGANSTTADTYLRIVDAVNLKDENGKNTITEVHFNDLQNWIYQVDVKANNESKIKLTALYAGATQYFKGSAEGGLYGLLSTDAQAEDFKIRLIYDFKTNHLIVAWLPDFDEEHDGGPLGADMMVIRKHNANDVQVTQLTLNNQPLTEVKTVYAVMTFTQDWIKKNSREQSIYWVSFPFDVKLSEAFGFGEYADAWIMQYYDGAERAKKGLYANSGTYWKYIFDKETVLKKGVGYVLVLDLNKVKFNHGVPSVSLYFPSNGEVGTITQIEEPNVTVEVPAHQCNLGVSSTGMDHNITDSHWNLIGVPAFKQIDQFDVTQYHYDQQDASFYYKFITNSSRYDVVSSNSVTFQALYSYMVQFAGTINWTTKKVLEVTPAQLAARRNGESELPEKISLSLEIAQGEEMADQTFVQLQQEGATTEFDMNLDLTKIINSGANIYTLAGEQRIQSAGNALPMGEALVPVGVQIAAEGEYTFRMPDGTEGMVVELIDYETNTRTNLLLSDYIVTLPKGTSENRFALHIQPQKDVVTSLENIGEGVNNGEAVNKYLIDGKLIIRTAEGVFDAQGKRL